MSRPRRDALTAIHRVEARAELTARAVDALREQAAAGVYTPPRGVPFDPSGLEQALLDALKVTAFATFEQAARSCWADHYGRDDGIRTRDLIDGLAARCGVPDDLRHELHRVRNHRNDPVHLDRRHPPQSLRQTCRACCRFLARFPDGWGRPS